MSVVAAFLWRKTNSSICTLIYDNESLEILSPPKIYYLSHRFFTFRKEAKKIIKDFTAKIQSLHQDKTNIVIEHKIVFNMFHIPWIRPAGQSKFVYDFFIKTIRKLQTKIKSVVLKPQLRKRLSGKPLKVFKRELRKMNLVSRKKETGYEYHLWTVALHATSNTYNKELQRLKEKLLEKYWDAPY